MRIAIIGCGFVADYYAATMALHPELHLLGAHDRDATRLSQFAGHYGVRSYATLDGLLADPDVELVVNLTNPRSHYDVTRLCLEAGRHVYSEKPIAMSLSEAKTLLDLAEDRGLHLTSAPCSLLGATAQTVWRGVRDGVIGTPRVVYAEMDEGMVYKMRYRRWVSASGAPWPYRDEFEVGTVVEHAGYVVSWLPAMFG